MGSSPPPHPRFGTGNWAWLNHPQNCMRFGEFGWELSLYIEMYQHYLFCPACGKMPGRGDNTRNMSELGD